MNLPLDGSVNKRSEAHLDFINQQDTHGLIRQNNEQVQQPRSIRIVACKNILLK